MSLTQRLTELGYSLPPVPEPKGSYVPAVTAGDLIFTAGQLPLRGGQLIGTGKVGASVSLQEAREAAEVCTLNALAAAASVAGGLDNLRRVLRVTGYVASAEGFNDQPQVLNAASELIGALLEEGGLHARSAVGVAELPLGAPVELEIVASIA